MKDNIMDSVVDGIKERGGWVTESLKKNYKNTKKFRQEPVSDDLFYEEYEKLVAHPYRDRFMTQLLRQYGQDAMRDFVVRMEKIRQRKGADG